MDSYQTTSFLEKKHNNLICIGLILLVGLLLFIRASYGFDWCDEGYYYSITYRLALGDRMFSDSWELHQTSAVVTLPLMKLFLHLNGGSTEGMVLLFRRIFVLFETAIAIYTFYIFKRRYQTLCALCCAVAFQVFVHQASPDFSYNSLAQYMTLLSWLFLFSYQDRGGNYKLLLAGASFALAVQNYPHFILILPVFALCLILLGKERKSLLRSVFLFGLGIGLVCIVFLIVLFARSSLTELTTFLPELFNDPHHPKRGFIWTLLNYFHRILVEIPLSTILASLLFVSIFVIRLGTKSLFFRIRPLLYLFCFFLVIITMTEVLFLKNTLDVKFNMLPICLLLAFPSLFLLENFRISPALYLVITGILASIGVQYASNMGFHAFGVPILFSAVGTILYIFESNYLKDQTYRKAFLRSGVAVLFVAVLFVCRILCLHWENAHLWELDAAYESGPLAGIYTIENRQQAYESIFKNLTDTDCSGRLLVVDFSPIVYTMCPQPPAEGHIWNMSMLPNRLSTYYQFKPENIPERIILIKEGIYRSSGRQNIQSILRILQEMGASYEQILEDPYCIIYRTVQK